METCEKRKTQKKTEENENVEGGPVEKNEFRK